MKTIKERTQEIDDLIRSVKKDSTEAEVKRVKRNVVFLRQIKLYLETEPREEFVKSELASVKTKIENIDRNYGAWQVGKVLTKYKDPHASYLNEMGLTNLKSQEKTLNFILNG